MTSGRSILIQAVLIGLVISACAGRRQAVVDERLREDAARALWNETASPLASATRALGGVLQRVDDDSAVFLLAGGTAQRRDGPVAAADLCSGEVAVFCHLVRSGNAAWWRFDPRSAGLVPVASGDHFVRLIPEGRIGRQTLALLRFEVTIVDGDLHLGDGVRLTDGGLREAVVTSSGEVVYLRRMEEGEALVAMPLAGGDERILIAAEEAPSAPYALSDGGLLVVLGTAGSRRPWRLDCAGGERTAWNEDLPAPRDDGLLLGVDDSLLPQVLALPERIDLAILLALVEARDPAINRRRALLAAALAESGQLHLPPLPSLRLGLDYTPVEGIFVDPIAGVGDVLSEGLMRGVIGLIQPIFDIPRQRMAAAAGSVRVAVAADLLAEEIGQRLADAAEEWTRFQHLHERLLLDQAMAANAASVLDRAQVQRSAGVGSEVDRLMAEHRRRSAVAALADDQRLITQLQASLRRRCGIAAGSTFDLRIDPLRAENLVIPDEAVAERSAVLNRPRLIAARRLAEEAFYTGEAGAPGLSGGLRADYGYVRGDNGGSAVSDYLTLSLDADLPLGLRGAARLSAERSAALVDAQRAAADAATADVRREARSAWAAAATALDDLAAATAERQWRAESARIARLWNERGGPDRDRPRDPGVGDSARYEYLQAAIVSSERSRDAFLAVARMWRSMGVDSGRLRGLLLVGTVQNRAGTSTWAWNPRTILSDPEAVITTLLAAEVSRVYCACGGDGELLTADGDVDGFRRFAQRAEGRGLQVWALLGEPAWLVGESGPDEALSRIAAFNATQGIGEPRIVGIKLDLEPQALPGWEDPRQRERLIVRWLECIDRTRAALPDVPLWIDIRPDELGISQIAERVDGATLMGYRHDPDAAVALARESLGRWSKPLEIGIELRHDAEAGQTVGSDWMTTREVIRAACSDFPNFAGTALHDYDGLEAILGTTP